ncbi:MAG: sulfatase-like hydrolase/transferase, partial [Planctomycetota bacterium]|nr:sulfatase-like hydrolase/transferase [Planctomycetota bacterium]
MVSTIGSNLAHALDPPDREFPNVLLIMTDDQGWGDITSHENSHLKTPRLDALAASGARLQRFYVSPVCAP